MKHYKILFYALFCVFWIQKTIADTNQNHPESVYEIIQGILKNLVEDNQKFVEQTEASHFEKFLKKQTPRATIVACSDSRAHTNAYDETPENDLFVIRNIGNQFSPSEGSVSYGVEVLKTPLLIFIGHTECGAVKAVLEKEHKISQSIKRDLKHIKIKNTLNLNQNVIININAQIQEAIHKYAAEIKKKELVVIGAVYDIHNTFKEGHGRLIFFNINGETSLEKLKENKLFNGLNDTKFLSETALIKK
jgi:carbonic anhydrase